MYININSWMYVSTFWVYHIHNNIIPNVLTQFTRLWAERQRTNERTNELSILVISSVLYISYIYEIIMILICIYVTISVYPSPRTFVVFLFQDYELLHVRVVLEEDRLGYGSRTEWVDGPSPGHSRATLYSFSTLYWVYGYLHHHIIKT